MSGCSTRSTPPPECGIKGAVIYDGGFAERGEDGRRLQAEIAGICREAGIALCGPNCMGVLNPHHPSTTYLQELRDPTGLAGNVGIVVAERRLLRQPRQRHPPLRLQPYRLVGERSGSECRRLSRISGRRSAHRGHRLLSSRPCARSERFAAALDRAWAADKPVIVLKVGRDTRTRRAIATHTGGEAGDSAAVSALLRSHHAIEVNDLVELTETLAACQNARRPAGRRIGVVTSSGGLAELILDVAAAADLEIPPLSAALRVEAERQIGFVTGDGNPLDAWGSGGFLDNLPYGLRMFEASSEHDAVVFCRDNGDGQPFEMPELGRRYIELFIQAARAGHKPHYLLHTRPGGMDRAQVAALRESGIAVVGGIREGLGAIDRLARWALSRTRE